MTGFPPEHLFRAVLDQGEPIVQVRLGEDSPALRAALDEVVSERLRAVANGMAAHDLTQSREVWVAKMAAELGYVSHFRRQDEVYRIHLISMAQLAVSALMAHDQNKARRSGSGGSDADERTPGL
jgi:hypothetical protein